MSRLIATILLAWLISAIGYSQTVFKDYKAGYTFNISLPDYMDKTIGLNDVATIQFKNSVKDIYGFVIVDTKEDLNMVEMHFKNAEEFYDLFIKDFLVDEKKRKISKSEKRTIEGNTYLESDASYYDEEADIDIYYFVGIIETPTSFLKLLCWSSLESKDTYKPDFQKILYSIKD